MSRANLKDRIKEGSFLLDGAMGTELFVRGVDTSACTAWICVESPEIVSDIHRAYFDAGSDAVITNTFGANKYALGRHGYSDRSAEINSAAAKIARDAAGEEGYVLGDIGPSGEFLEPLGTLKPVDLKTAYVEQAQGLAEGGIDGFIIETMTALEEVVIAIEAAKSVEGGIAVFASMAFETSGGQFRTMMGVDVPSAVSEIVSLGVDAVGFNCGKATMEEYETLAEILVKSVNGDGVVLYAEPNAGLPEVVEGELVYKVTPEDFAEGLMRIKNLGINILGGCCGTGPEHIRAVAEKVRLLS